MSTSSKNSVNPEPGIRRVVKYVPLEKGSESRC